MTRLSDSLLQNATLFISDTHLGGFDDAENHEIERDLLSLLEAAYAQKMRIFIVGDLLDYFLKHGDYVPDVGEKVLTSLARYSKSTSEPVVYITGNHDNWDDGYFDSLGFETCYEYLKLDFDGRELLLLHGDGLSAAHMRFPRPLFHRFLRNPYFVHVFKVLTAPRLANRIMFHFSNLSRRLTRGKGSNHKRVDSWARKYLRENDTDVIICGHHHHKRFEEIGTKLYINLGAFYLDRTCGLYTNDGFQLVTWQESDNKFWIIGQETAKHTA